MVDLMFVRLVNERTKIWLSNLISSAMKREFKVRSLLCIGFKGFTSPWHSWGKKRIIARAMGDAVYLMQCKPVQVHIAIPKFCSDELPVFWTIPISILYVAHEFWQNKPQKSLAQSWLQWCIRWMASGTKVMEKHWPKQKPLKNSFLAWTWLEMFSVDGYFSFCFKNVVQRNQSTDQPINQ